MSLSQNIAHQIIQNRKVAKMTQYQLAKEVGVPQSTIARIESGEVSFSTDTLEKIAKIYPIQITIGECQLDYESIEKANKYDQIIEMLKPDILKKILKDV